MMRRTSLYLSVGLVSGVKKVQTVADNTCQSAIQKVMSRHGLISEKQDLEKKLEAANLALEKAQAVDAAAEASANRGVNLFIGGNFAFLTGQFALLFHWVFFAFDWNLVEPVTYFLGYTCVWMGVMFFKRTGQDFTYDAILDEIRNSRRQKVAKQFGADVLPLEDARAARDALVKEIEEKRV